MIFWLVLKLEISYIDMISSRILVSFRGFFFEDYNFCMVKYLNFHNASLALRYFFNVNGKATVCHKLLNLLKCLGAHHGFKLCHIFIVRGRAGKSHCGR